MLPVCLAPSHFRTIPETGITCEKHEFSNRCRLSILSHFGKMPTFSYDIFTAGSCFKAAVHVFFFPSMNTVDS